MEDHVDAWKQTCELRVQEDYCDQDNFGMHVYNDFNAYGLIALIEMQVGQNADNGLGA